MFPERSQERRGFEVRRGALDEGEASRDYRSGQRPVPEARGKRGRVRHKQGGLQGADIQLLRVAVREQVHRPPTAETGAVGRGGHQAERDSLINNIYITTSQFRS